MQYQFAALNSSNFDLSFYWQQDSRHSPFEIIPSKGKLQANESF